LHTGSDLKKLREAELLKHFGKTGKFFYKIVRGIDDREVVPDRETKSVGAEDTFLTDLVDVDEMHLELDKLAVIVSERLQNHQLKGRTITLKIKYHDFRISSKSRSFAEGIDSQDRIGAIARELLSEGLSESKRVRLLGITLSNFGESGRVRKNDASDQLTFW
jgi:DNA polymerase IV